MSVLKLFKSEPNIDEADLESLEAGISYPLPSSFKDFYLSNNGGVSDKDWWEKDDGYEPVRLKKFKAVAKIGAIDAAETKFLGGCYAVMTAKEVIPKTLLPFANDDGGNFFCLDLADGNVCFYATDSFDSDCSLATNHARAYRWLAKSFGDFIEGLKDESEVDI
jgi:cell wall assembly regulator SMI1